MKKYKYLLFIVFAFLICCSDLCVNAISNVETVGKCGEYNNKCSVYKYNINKNGETKNDFGIEIGIVHFKDIDSNNANEEYIVSYSSCTDCAEGSLFNTTQNNVSVKVNSSTAKAPLAICAVPMNGSGYLNENLTDSNARDYIYFNETEIKTAINNKKCEEKYIFYDSNSVSYTCNNKTVLTNFTATKDLTNTNVTTSSFSSGSVCQISIKKDDFSKVYNHNNPSNGCKSSNYQVSCHYISSNRYDCTLYSCGSSIVQETEKSKTCTLVNMNDSSEEIKFSYSYEFNGIDYDQSIEKNGKIVTDPIPFGGDVSETYISTKSCPMYIYRVKDSTSVSGYKWRILESEEIRKSFEENNFSTIIMEKYKWGTSENPVDPNNGGINWGDKIEVNCEGIIGEDALDFINEIFRWIQIIAPIFVIIISGVEFGGAVLLDDKDALKKASSKLIKRLIIAVAIFFIPMILSFVLDVFNEASGAFSSTCGIGE